MYVNVTAAQFNAIRIAAMKMEITGDSTQVRGMLAVACLGNGGDYRPIPRDDHARLFSVDLRVIG